MATSLLDRAIYSYADVDRLVGVHTGTARRWLEGYTRGGHTHSHASRSLMRTASPPTSSTYPRGPTTTSSTRARDSPV